jgi:hypothetical protein
MDPRERTCENVNWKELVQGRVQVACAYNDEPVGFVKIENFLISWIITIYSRKTLFPQLQQR